MKKNWPDKDGHPLNPNVSAFHWLKGGNGLFILRWTPDIGWGDYPKTSPQEMAGYDVKYVGPCVIGDAALEGGKKDEY